MAKTRLRVESVLRCRQLFWRCFGICVFLFAAVVFAAPPIALAFVVISLPIGFALAVRCTRCRLPSELFTDRPDFERAVRGVLSDDDWFHLSVRKLDQFVDDEKPQLAARYSKRRFGLKSAEPFLSAKFAEGSFIATPTAYWLQPKTKIETGLVSHIKVEAFSYEHKTLQPDDGDDVVWSTWLHATKSGDRDYRYRENYEIWLVKRYGVELRFRDYSWYLGARSRVKRDRLATLCAMMTGQVVQQQPEAALDAAAPEAWYNILGVSSDASKEEVAAAYRQRMLEYHPDRVATLGAKLRALAEAEAKSINAAYAAALRKRS